MKSKKLLAAALTVGAMALVAGMSVSAADELTVAIWDNNQKPGLQEIADEWTQTSGVDVNINVMEWDSYWTLLEAGASGGDMPDVFWMHSDEIEMYMENDLLLNLNDYIAADDEIDLDNYYEDITELYNLDGVQYAVPKDHDTIALLYNKAIFDKYGVDYPTDDWTWDDVYEAAAAITEAGADDGVYGFAANSDNGQDFYWNVIYDYGAELITADHKGTTIGSEEGKEAMEMVRKIISVGVPQAIVSESGVDSLFQSNQVGMTTAGSWMVISYFEAENHDDYVWSLIPYADTNGNGECDEGERYSCYNGLGWAAAYNTDMPDEAYSLISFFCSEYGQERQAELGVTMAAYKGISEMFVNGFEGMDLEPFVAVEEEGDLFFHPYTRNSQVWGNAIVQQGCFLDAWLDPDDPEVMAQACDNAQRIIDDAIAEE